MHKIKLYRITSQRNLIPEDLMKASKVWEEQLKDCHVTTPGKPIKLAILLSHKYTEANLDFDNLKGRDLVMADHLRSSGAFEVHLALIVRDAIQKTFFSSENVFRNLSKVMLEVLRHQIL